MQPKKKKYTNKTEYIHLISVMQMFLKSESWFQHFNVSVKESSYVFDRFAEDRAWPIPL